MSEIKSIPDQIRNPDYTAIMDSCFRRNAGTKQDLLGWKSIRPLEQNLTGRKNMIQIYYLQFKLYRNNH